MIARKDGAVQIVASGACPINCTDHGVCAPGGFCVCLGGYTGLACEKRACENDCSGHGRCDNGTCMCAPGYTRTIAR